MKTDVKTAVDILNELNGSYADLLNSMKESIKEVKITRKLWRNGEESRLIKLGLKLILFPEPTPIIETVGVCFIAAGAIQKGIKNQTIYIEDIFKTFQSTLKELRMATDNLY